MRLVVKFMLFIVFHSLFSHSEGVSLDHQGALTQQHSHCGGRGACSLVCLRLREGELDRCQMPHDPPRPTLLPTDLAIWAVGERRGGRPATHKEWQAGVRALR